MDWDEPRSAKTPRIQGGANPRQIRFEVQRIRATAIDKLRNFLSRRVAFFDFCELHVHAEIDSLSFANRETKIHATARGIRTVSGNVPRVVVESAQKQAVAPADTIQGEVRIKEVEVDGLLIFRVVHPHR